MHLPSSHYSELVSKKTKTNHARYLENSVSRLPQNFAR